MKLRLPGRRLAITGFLAVVVAVFLFLWWNWAAITLQDPRLSEWESPSGAGSVQIYWNHSLRPRVSVYVAPSERSEPLIHFGTFDDDELHFAAIFYWSHDGQIFVALDMPRWWLEILEDEKGATLEAPIFTHAYDFSTGSSIGHALGEGGNATAFLERHERIEALMAVHGGVGDSFSVEEIRARERRLSMLEWPRWSKRMRQARDPFAPPR